MISITSSKVTMPSAAGRLPIASGEEGGAPALAAAPALAPASFADDSPPPASLSVITSMCCAPDKQGARVSASMRGGA